MRKVTRYLGLGIFAAWGSVILAQPSDEASFRNAIYRGITEAEAAGMADIWLGQNMIENFDADTQRVWRTVRSEGLSLDAAVTKHLQTYYADSSQDERDGLRAEIVEGAGKLEDLWKMIVLFEALSYGPETGEAIVMNNIQQYPQYWNDGDVKYFRESYGEHTSKGESEVQATVSAVIATTRHKDQERGIGGQFYAPLSFDIYLRKIELSRTYPDFDYAAFEQLGIDTGYPYLIVRERLFAEYQASTK